ncbi:unnamed protein product [Chrysoparadoxa australica]
MKGLLLCLLLSVSFSHAFLLPTCPPEGLSLRVGLTHDVGQCSGGGGIPYFLLASDEPPILSLPRERKDPSRSRDALAVASHTFQNRWPAKEERGLFRWLTRKLRF